MSRLSVVVATPLMLGLAACSGAGSDYPIGQPGGIDAAVDGHVVDAMADAIADAHSDAPPDAPPHGAELSIAITGAPDPVAASSTLTYTINVINHGDLDATNVVVIQRLPSGNVSYQTATGIGWTCNAAGQLVTCSRATLLIGDAPSIDVKVTTPPTGGTITTSASVAADTADPDQTNNDASESAIVLTPADLGIAISDAPDPVAAGGTLTYTIAVSNSGPGASIGLTVLDSLPAGVGYVNASGPGWSCSAMTGTVTCLAASLAAAASSSITLVTTAPGSGGTVSNTASVSAMTPDGNQANNAATTSTTVNAAADLSIAMSDSPDPVFGSGTLQYAIDVTNLGPNTASGITVTDSLPAGNVAFLAASGSGWTCAAAGQVVTCTRPSLLVGAAPTITISVRAPSEATMLTNAATVTSTSSDLNAANNTATVLTDVLSAADLSVAVIDAPDPVTTGGALTYTVTANNAGPSQASNVTVTSTFPSGVAVLTAAGINWTCDVNGQQATCTMATMAVGPAPAIAIATTAPGVDGSITMSSTIGSPTTDPAPGNNTASQTTVVNAPSDLALVLTASPSPVPAHATLTYTIGVTNLGPRDATNLVVTNRLPDGDVQYLGATGIGWTCALAGQIVTCTRPLLIAGVAPSIAIQITTPPVHGTLVDQATVTATTADLDLDNNTATDTTSVFDSADLSVATSETPNPVRIGTSLSYTLSVANNGPTPATAVTVVDTLPPGTSFVSAAGSGWACNVDNTGQVVTCTMAGLANASSAPAITIAAIAPGTAGNITNTATVSSATSDPNLANNTATTVTLANAFADLEVAIGDSPDPVLAGGNVLYSIDVTNNGPDDATGVKVVTLLPLNGTFFEAVGDGWVCPAPSGGFLTCTRTGLDRNTSAPTIKLTWTAPNPGGFSIVATPTVSGTSTDPDPSNNTATDDTTVRP
ncbi:MAG TPA: hypothetical protein VIX73_03465 [Kofleriaceae bacterium]